MTENVLRSKLPADAGLSTPMQAFHQNVERRQLTIAGMDDIDTGTITLPELAAVVQSLIEANRR